MNIRTITVGNVHAEPGDPLKVATMYVALVRDPGFELPPLLVSEKSNGTFRIHDGRHRFLAYVLAERDTILVELR